ncbi:MAG: glycosyltransferase family 39 protein [Flavobacteriales bacterium]|nr:glycosyltransferase family 39 protein [Flavobacteriales bacterium]
MISRNLLETDNNPLFPRVDNGGRHETGIIASEFPVFNYLVYLISTVFGYDHWYGRLINLIFSSLAGWFFYKSLKFYFSERISFAATILLMVSIWFSFSRKSMPDVFSMALMIIAFYNLILYQIHQKGYRLILFGSLSCLALLSKIPVLYSFAFLPFFIFQKDNKPVTKISILAVSAISLSVMFWWYFVWGKFLLSEYGYQLYFPESLSTGFAKFREHLSMAAERFYFSAFQGFLAFMFFLTGIYFTFKKKILAAASILISGFVIFMVFIIKTGDVFALHSYYIIPFVPVMSIIAAIGLDELPEKLYSLALVLISFESVANQQHDFFNPGSELFKLELEREINQSVPKGIKIALAGSTGPQYLYFAHRKGWGLSVEQTLNSQYMNEVYDKGYRYLVVINRELEANPGYTLIASGKYTRTYQLIRKEN